MNTQHAVTKRLLLTAVLAAAVLATSALSGASAGAQPAPISAIKVRAGGTEAAVSFTTSEPMAVTVEHKPVTAAAGQQPVQKLDGVFQAVATPTPTGPVKIFDGIFQVARAYATTHERTLAGLKSNTTYDVVATAETKAGQKHTAQARFTTAKQRVRITLREINIERDGDTIGDGEPRWLVSLLWGANGRAAGCYPNNGAYCESAGRGDGRFQPRNYLGQPLMWLFAEENFDAMPDGFQLLTKAEENDLVDILQAYPEALLPDWERVEGVVRRSDWTVPPNKEFASQPFTIRADHGSSGQDFKSVMTFTFELFHDNLSYPAARNAPQSTWSR
jgi:hypothetical protein